MLTRADFTSTQEVRWCPGCGDYAILAAMQRVLPSLGILPKDLVFISGIGCSGRFPYYMNTYGFHTIHGRAPAVATGLKLTRPDLSVWIITGDGDGLSIGANHLIHLIRRNVDVKVLLFNNQIYGLTKGQCSPTSAQGKITVSTPEGSRERPLDPLKIAIAAGATFAARVLDIDAQGLSQVIRAAASHVGTAFIEIYQNCNIFNDGAFAHLSDKAIRAKRTLWLEAGQPLRYGQQEAVRFVEGKPECIASADRIDLPIHQPENLAWTQQLLQLVYPDFPVPMGILRQVKQPIFSAATAAPSQGLTDLLHSGSTWTIV